MPTNPDPTTNPDPGDYKNIQADILKGKEEILKKSAEQVSVEKKVLAEKNKILNSLMSTVDLQSAMTEEIRRTSTISYKLNKHFSEGTGILSSYYDRIKKIGGEISNFSLNEWYSSLNKSRYISERISASWGEIGAFGTAVFIVAKKIFQTFLDWDKAMFDVRKNFGMLRDETLGLENTLNEIYSDLIKVGVSFSILGKSVVSLSKQMGGVWNVSKDLTESVALMNSQFGISTDISAKFLKNLAMMGGNTLAANRHLLFFTKQLSIAAGTSLPGVMRDVSSLSDEALNLMAKFPLQIVKSIVEFRRLGTTINDVSRASASILNFTDSINKEMEASVLLGQSLNLQRARQLSYQGRLEESNAEMLKQARALGFQTRMDYFQRKATADAMGMSVESLMTQLNSQDEINKALRSGDVNVRNMAKEYARLRNMNGENAKIEAASAESRVRSLANQERMVSISNSWSKIVQKLGYVVLPAIDWILGKVADNLGVILAIGASVYTGLKLTHMGWVGILARIRDVMAIFSQLGKVAVVFGSWWNRITFKPMMDAIGFLGKGFTRLKPLLGFVGGIVSKIGTILGRFVIPLMFAWNIFQEIKKILNDPVLMGTEGFLAFNGKLIFRALGAVGRALWTTFNDLAFGIPGKLLAGIASISNSLFGALLDPFRKMWDWLGKTFLGSSPSQLGLMIVKGILSINTMLFDAITSPFSKAWKWITDKFSSIASIFGFASPIETKMTTTGVGTSTFTPASRKIEGSSVVDTAVATENNTSLLEQILQANLDAVKSNNGIMEAVNALTDMMKNGGITTTMDSQLVSATIARSTEFRRGYGVNKV